MGAGGIVVMTLSEIYASMRRWWPPGKSYWIGTKMHERLCLLFADRHMQIGGIKELLNYEHK